MDTKLFNDLWLALGYEDKDGFLCVDVDGVTYWLEYGKVWSNV